MADNCSPRYVGGPLNATTTSEAMAADLTQVNTDALRAQRNKYKAVMVALLIIDSMLLVAFLFLVAKKGFDSMFVSFIPIVLAPAITMLPMLSHLSRLNAELQRRGEH